MNTNEMIVLTVALLIVIAVIIGFDASLQEDHERSNLEREVHGFPRSDECKITETVTQCSQRLSGRMQ